MKVKNLSVSIVVLLLFSGITVISHAQLFRPYKCGPVLKEDGIQMFDSLNQYLEIEPGDVFAEIGASSGYYNGAMAVYLDGVTFYLQDIDKSCLNEENLKKVLDYYSKLRGARVDRTNEFYIAIGTETKTNLPRESIDVMYCNATYHVLSNPDAILADLFQSLKKEGTLSIRDQFSYDGETQYCEDKKCGHLVAHYNVFMEAMKRNGFMLIDTSKQFGYPIYKFKKNPDGPL